MDVYNLDQMSLFCAISEAISFQGKIPADNRSNAIIHAANIIVMSYGMTNDEFVSRFGTNGEGLSSK